MRTPQEIINNLTEKRQSLINKVLAQISSELERSFSGQPLDIWLYDESDSQLKQIEKVLKVKLRKSGWSLVIHPSESDYRNGSSTKLTIAAIPTAGCAKESISYDDDEHFEQQWER